LVRDDGPGLPQTLEDPDRIFELGFSRTSGSGLGLYHVRQVLGDMGGSITIFRSERGAAFAMRITK
jgi:sensor histidine kinase regulating citrate/malate metabolism